MRCPTSFKNRIASSPKTPDVCIYIYICICQFVNFVIRGDVPIAAQPSFFGASLVALTKKDGGVRPIAVGCTLRRLVTKCASHFICDAMGALLAPLQFGYGTPMGAEAAVHAARTYLHNIQPGCLMLKVDFRNAFNSIHRDKVLSSVMDKAPEIYPLAYSAYSQPSLLFFGNSILESAEGVQQGDPLGPLFFSLAIHDMVSSLKSQFRLFYLDDGTLGGTLEEVKEDLHVLESAAELLGLHLNHSKSEVICSDTQTRSSMLTVSPSFHCVDPANATLLGSPIGGVESVDSTLSSKKDSLQLLGERLKLLHAHDALCLLRSAFSLPKVLYILRSAPCFRSMILLEMDDLLKSLLESICNVQLSDRAWTQASLPVKAGGLGIRSFAMLAHSAFLASAAGTSEISNYILPPPLRCSMCPFRAEALQAWSQGHGEEPPTGSNISVQKAWDNPHIEASFNSLLVGADPPSKSRLLASQRRESGAWLCAPPVSALGLRMEDETVRIAVGLRLGAPLCTPHNCLQCGDPVDESGYHGLSCRRSIGRQARHAALNDLVKRSLTAIDTPALLEPPGLFRSDGKRPDGVTVIPWKRGRALVWDVTCADTFATSYVSLASTGAGQVANQAEQRKRQKYSDLATRCYTFVPIAVETSGVFGEEAMQFFREVGRLTRLKSNDPKSFQYLCQKISVCIQRFNSSAILGSSNG